MHLFPLISRYHLNSPLLIRTRVLQGDGTLFCSPRRPGISSLLEDPRTGSPSGFCPSGHPYPGCIYIRSWLSGTGTFLRALPFLFSLFAWSVPGQGFSMSIYSAIFSVFPVLLTYATNTFFMAFPPFPYCYKYLSQVSQHWRGFCRLSAEMPLSNPGRGD